MLAPSVMLSPAPSPTSALSIAGRAGHAFTPHAMLQGFACHARGVELPASGPAAVHARVRSKRVHDVHLRAAHGKLFVACSCPARSLGLDLCKHVWAALLEIDRRDALGDLRNARGPLTIEPAPEPRTPAPEDAPPKRTAAKKPRAAGVSDVIPTAAAQRSAKAAETEPARRTPRRGGTTDAQPKALAKTTGPMKKGRPATESAADARPKKAAAARRDAEGTKRPAKRARAGGSRRA